MNRIAIALVGMLAACDAFGLEQAAVKTRAANDLKCDSKQLATTDNGAHGWTVNGCGGSANYTCIRGEGIGESQWSCMREKQ